MVTMHLLRALILTALLAAPAAASTGLDLVDPCLDADQRILTANGSQLSVGSGADPYDLATTTFRSVPGGVVVSIGVCGDMPLPAVANSGWGVAVDLPEFAGSLSVSLTDFRAIRTPRVTRRFTSDRDPESVIPSGVTVADRTITFALQRDLLPESIAEALVPGTAWMRPAGSARSGTQHGYTDPDRGLQVMTPGTWDQASGEGTFIVGG